MKAIQLLIVQVNPSVCSTKEEANRIQQEKGYQFVEDAGRGYRRVVPSPQQYLLSN